MYGWPFAPYWDPAEGKMVTPGTKLGPPTVRVVYCGYCEVSELAAPNVPCFCCDAPMTTERPKYWPQNTGPHVLGGRTYDPVTEGGT